MARSAPRRGAGAEERRAADGLELRASKQIRRGDRLFLLRQGVEPRGIVASGWATSDWYEGPGWRRAGVPCNYLDWKIDVLLDARRDPILPREALSHGVLGRMYWDTQVSGIRIPDDVARELENAWRAVARVYLLRKSRHQPDP